jgi:hypothetical protein
VIDLFYLLRRNWYSTDIPDLISEEVPAHLLPSSEPATEVAVMNATRSTTFLSVLCAAAGAVAIGLAASTAQAESSSLDGIWNGGGTVIFPSGDKERARCRATFRKDRAGYKMHAVCTTASARAAQTAELKRVSGNRYSGEFFNAEFNVSGIIRVIVNGNSLSAFLSGGGAQANLSLSR